MFQIAVSARFRAAHQLPLPNDGLEPLHEHDWRVTVTFAGPGVDGRGVLLDFNDAQRRLHAVLAPLDGRNLNRPDVLEGCAQRSPSAEAVAAHIAGCLRRDLPVGVRLHCVEVEEAPGCVARYLPEHQ